MHGTIWLAYLDPVVANEQAGRRPVMVVSADRTYNQLPIDHAIVVPLTTRDRGLPHQIRIEPTADLPRVSFALPEYVRAVSRQRLIRQLSAESFSTVAEIVTWIHRFIPNGSGFLTGPADQAR